MMKSVAVASLLSVLTATTAFAAGEGKAVGVNPDASAKGGSAERVLVVGADVSVGETITTGPSGRVQLLFQDQTRIVVGPRSSLVIESYLLNGNQASSFAVDALSGTFRFISGNSPKSAYSVETPTASIAVRGTKYDLTVGSGQTLVMLYEGALQLCQGGTCYDLVDRCDVAVTGGGNSGLYKWIGDRSEITRYFPLPNIQSSFLADFRVGGAQACLVEKAQPSNDSSSSMTSGGEGSETTPPPPYTTGGGSTPPTTGNGFSISGE